MKRFTPLHGMIVILLFVGVVVYASLDQSSFIRVGPDREGMLRLDVSDLEPRTVRFYRFLNHGNQEVKFFVGRDQFGEIQVAFDASETDYKRKRGFTHQGDWMVNNKCETASRLSEINTAEGGCKPVPLQHRLEGDALILAESDILAGWRYFR